MTAIMAARSVASALASGPALLILLSLLLGRLTHSDVMREAIGKLVIIVAYAMQVSVFFLRVELFTAEFRTR